MKDARPLTLDTNILFRAILGVRVFQLLDTYADTVKFYAPDLCFAEVRKNIPLLAERGKVNPERGLILLEELFQIVEVVGRTEYEVHEGSARRRIASRDAADWPVLATALLLDGPLWTEDQDFFGTGVATWTTNNVEIYFKGE